MFLSFLTNAVLTSITYFIGKTFSDDLASSLCCVLICLTSLYSTLYSLYTFIIYLFLDTFFKFLDTFFRSTKIDNEILFHHIAAFILTFLGIIGIQMKNETSIVAEQIANLFITMEFTTPFIHLVKYYKHTHQTFQTILCSMCILIFWIPFRLIRPFQALQLILKIYHVHYIYVLIFFSGLSLYVMQIYWYIRLCVLAFNLFFKI